MERRSPSATRGLGLALLVGTLAGCGRGAGGAAGGGGEPRPEPQLLLSTSQIPPTFSIAFDGGRVLLGSGLSLGAMDMASASYTPLAGALIDPDSSWGLGAVDHPMHVVRSGDWLYFDSWGYRIQRLFVGDDGRAAIDELVPAAVMWDSGCLGLQALAADERQVYWAMSCGDTSEVFARPLAGGDARLLATFPGQTRLTAAGSRLYVASFRPASGATVAAVDPDTGAVSTIQADAARDVRVDELPRTASAAQLFWMDGTTLRAVAHGASDPGVVATGLTAIERLATDGASVYALQRGATGDAILRIDVASGDVTPVVARGDLRAILAYGGKLWWLTGLTLEVSNPDGSEATTLYTSDGAAIVFGGTGKGELVGVSGQVVAASGEYRLLVYDVAGGSSRLLQPAAGADLVAVSPHAFFAASQNSGVAQIPVDVPLRMPETLAEDLVTIYELFLDDGWLYWSEYYDESSVYRISRMRTDGSGREVLFDGVHRDLALHDGRLFFLCEAACGLPAWALVSMPFSGGPVAVEGFVGLFPQQLVAANGLLYLLDTADAATFGVWAIDVAGGRSAQIVRDLELTGIWIDVSARWLYVWAHGALERRSVESWDRLGAPQVVDAAASSVNRVYAFRSDGTDLYYWLQADGLKKLAE